MRKMLALTSALAITVCSCAKPKIVPQETSQIEENKGGNSSTIPPFPGKNWEYANEEQLKSWDKTELNKAEIEWRKSGTSALMVVENGKIVAEWESAVGNTKKNMNCHSVRKSFLSALYGVYSNQIDINKTLANIGIGDNKVAGGLSDTEKEATIRNLLMAKSGIYLKAAYETAAMAANRPARYSHAPGTFYYYNNWDFNALGTIFTNRTGKGIDKTFDENIATKIGMQDFSINNYKNIYISASQHPAYTFTMSPRDRARFGLLFLNKGKWNGQQVIPEKWVTESTSQQTATTTNPSANTKGYGYLWWTSSTNNKQYSYQFKQPSYSARGNHGQIIMVIPEKNMVIVQATDSGGGEDDDSSDTSFDNVLKKIMDARGN